MTIASCFNYFIVHRLSEIWVRNPSSLSNAGKNDDPIKNTNKPLSESLAHSAFDSTFALTVSHFFPKLQSVFPHPVKLKKTSILERDKKQLC